MFIIAHTDNCKDKAMEIAAKLSDVQAISMEDALQDPQMLGDFSSLGLVYEQEGRGIPACTVAFIRDVLGSYDLCSLEYMFNVCVCEGKPQHSLKIVEKLCSKVGCAPSLNVTIRKDEPLSDLCARIANGDIQLAKGSIGTMFFMKANKIR